MGSRMSRRLDFLLAQWSSAWGGGVPQETLGNIWRPFSLLQHGGGAAGVQWVEVKGTTPHPMGTGHLQDWLLGLQGPGEKMAFDLIDTDQNSL